MQDFNLRNAIARIQKEGDIFKPVLGKGIDMKKATKKPNAESIKPPAGVRLRRLVINYSERKIRHVDCTNQ